jgi:hypothetical protein
MIGIADISSAMVQGSVLCGIDTTFIESKATKDPTSKDPVSPKKTRAGGVLKKRKPQMNPQSSKQR